MTEAEKRFTGMAVNHMKDRTIIEVRYLTSKEAAQCGFRGRPLVMILDNGTAVIPMKDDEGNDGGALTCLGDGNETEEILPLLR